MKKEKIKLSFSQIMSLLCPFISSKILFQVKLVSFIFIYLIVFYVFVLKASLTNSWSIFVGLLTVVLGLTFFLEGLVMAIMPLGEFCGKKLPGKIPLFFILIFAFVLGIVSTLAEPAVAILQSSGSSILPWKAPLLFSMLNKNSNYLIYAVATGVGLAVVLGFFKFIYSISLKPFLYVLIPLVSFITIYSLYNPNVKNMIGLAWDCGGITTGPVTVPLVIALGLGVSRMYAGSRSESGGFGIVTLASVLPIICVLILGFFLSINMPKPTDEFSFFKDEKTISSVFGNGEEALKYAKKNCNIETIKLLEQKIDKSSLNVDKELKKESAIKTNIFKSVRAVLPLTLILLFIAFVVIREKVPDMDLIVLGTCFALFGFALFGFGMEKGLAYMGSQVGSKIPKVYNEEINKTTINNFSKDLIEETVFRDGKRKQFFFFNDDEKVNIEYFNKENFDEVNGNYTIVKKIPALYGKIGYIIAVLFAVIMGYGATIAEPALIALGIKLEEISAGTFKRKMLVKTVAIGVGLGMVIGVLMLLFNFSFPYIIVGLYSLLLIFTIFSSEEFVSVAWDSAGVTTGPITVPLVVALGLGLGTTSGAIDGFGILAVASACPILTVLVAGIFTVSRRRKIFLEEGEK